MRSGRDLDMCLADNGPLGVVIAVQGGHVLDGDPGNIARLRELGVGMFAAAHVMDNSLVGSSTGRRGRGLTAYGREVVDELQGAHAAPDGRPRIDVAGQQRQQSFLHAPPVARRHEELAHGRVGHPVDEP